MRFIRENIFLVSLIGVVVVVGGILLAMNLSAAGDVGDRIAERAKLSDALQKLRMARVNRSVVNAERIRVEAVRGGAEKVVRASVEWNRRNYPVIMLSANNEPVPAFPIDVEKYKRFGLTYVFTQKYIAAMRELLKPLKPTAAATQGELDTEIILWQKKLERLHERKERMDAKGKEKPRVVTGTGHMPEMAPLEGAMPARSRHDGALSSSDITAQAKENAMMSLKAKKARMGLIYLSGEALDMVFPKPTANATESQLWQAQVSLWVTSDILGAIGETNQQAIRSEGAEIKKETVLNAAVKRLVKIDIADGYFSGGGAGAAPAGGGMPGYERGMMPEMDMMRPGGHPRPGRATPPRSTPRTSLKGASAFADNLSQRVSGREYDVVHYNFTVIMPAKNIAALQRNLLKRNYHTALKVELSQADEPADSMYYYGTDSVMQVTIEGELLLLTAWERGAWDQKTGSWSEKFPPLMPLQVLKEQFVESALRAEDLRRMQE